MKNIASFDVMWSESKTLFFMFYSWNLYRSLTSGVKERSNFRVEQKNAFYFMPKMKLFLKNRLEKISKLVWDNVQSYTIKSPS